MGGWPSTVVTTPLPISVSSRDLRIVGGQAFTMSISGLYAL